MAQTIVNCLKKQAGNGKGILCTIHQPSSALFTMFDRVLVMAEGRVAYFGPVPEVLDFLRL
jgi:ABC-type multidrug transport system ATPase subunit